ncbi:MULTISPECIES: permease-like cell division protein FtsX [Methylobacillus]|uniref:Cell division protein FtsX n=1 Tax=Methylobacillus flagellatus (strain ATCC 51484 / DSM 6875 / VKM B-1610 / KT) TaxID=265072 RepID=Q1H3D8_METFK|nr:MULTISPECIES: permease-like cell division protein FtsX [Methylobacillus]ABE48999.1 cell division protein FtsX [Methylobacillus flagellatus KT]MPS49658.1 ABC transporter permease [Methylobacillus sp.]
MKHWINQHTQVWRLVLSRIMRNKLSTLMIWGVIGIALSLPAILYIVIDNLNQLAGNIRNEPQISVFMKLDAEAALVKEFNQTLQQHPGIAKYQFVSKEAAWQEMQESQNIASQLEENPLPDAFFIEPKDHSPDAISRLHHELQGYPGVEHVLADADWAKRLYALLQLGRKAVWVLSGLLGFALVAIIGNTIRLQIATQREEIEVSKLIGATDGFIRRPFLYAGSLYGLGGSLLALGFVNGILTIFNFSVAELAELYGSSFILVLPGWEISLGIVACAVVLGWLGSYIAVSRSLASLNPH